MRDNSLLPERQSAYRPYHSTKTAVTIVHHDIVCSTAHCFVSALVLLDLSPAFDTVDHEVLMNVLKDQFSTGHHQLDWFRSYHSERQHTYKTSVDSSGPLQLTSSVPQGSVLGPQ